MMSKTFMRNRIATIILIMMATINATAQNKKFTLEELNFGGKNYRQTVP